MRIIELNFKVMYCAMVEGLHLVAAIGSFHLSYYTILLFYITSNHGNENSFIPPMNYSDALPFSLTLMLDFLVFTAF